MTWLDKLQRKFGRIGIPNLMLYIVEMCIRDRSNTGLPRYIFER